MPKFTVLIERLIPALIDIEIEADDMEQAAAKAEAIVNGGDDFERIDEVLECDWIDAAIGRIGCGAAHDDHLEVLEINQRKAE